MSVKRSYNSAEDRFQRRAKLLQTVYSRRLYNHTAQWKDNSQKLRVKSIGKNPKTTVRRSREEGEITFISIKNNIFSLYEGREYLQVWHLVILWKDCWLTFGTLQHLFRRTYLETRRRKKNLHEGSASYSSRQTGCWCFCRTKILGRTVIQNCSGYIISSAWKNWNKQNRPE